MRSAGGDYAAIDVGTIPLYGVITRETSEYTWFISFAGRYGTARIYYKVFHEGAKYSIEESFINLDDIARRAGTNTFTQNNAFTYLPVCTVVPP